VPSEHRPPWPPLHSRSTIVRSERPGGLSKSDGVRCTGFKHFANVCFTRR
jgi:hypothetical protein